MDRPKQENYKRKLPFGLIEDSHYQYSKAQDRYIDFLEKQNEQLRIADVSNTVCQEHAHHKMYDEHKDEYYCEICEPERQTDF